MTCEGIFADTVHWAIEKTEEEMKDSVGENGDESDKKKYLRLVSEYKKFKKNNCRHFSFNSTANSSHFGKFRFDTYAP